MNFVTIRTKREQIPEEYFYKWAKHLSDNKVYFIFLYTVQHAPECKQSQFTRQIIENIKKIAGKYFIGDMLGEVGSVKACKLPGYFSNCPEAMPQQGALNIKEAHDNYIEEITRLVNIDKELGIDNIVTVEATVLNSYNIEAGSTFRWASLCAVIPR